MAPKRPKPPSNPARPSRPADAAADATDGDPVPSRGAAAAAHPQAALRPLPARSEKAAAALQKSGVTAAMLSVMDELRARLRGPQARVSAQAADPRKLGAPNVVGTALGMHYTNGRPNGRRGPVVYVATKSDAENVAAAFQVPPSVTVGGEPVPVDVIEVGRPTALFGGFQTLEDQPRYGASIGRSGGSTGTFGVRARRNHPDEDRRPTSALSNAHVLVYDQFGNPASVGDHTRIVHPGDADAGFGPQTDLGHLLDYVELNLVNGNGPSDPNYVDAAIAWTSKAFTGATFHNDYEFDPEPYDLDALNFRLAVIKEGRTTGYTEGTIDALDMEVDVGYRPQGYPPLTGTFHNQILIRGTFGSFSQPGDSGSLVLALVDGVYRPVGLLFAGDGHYTWANPITAVMEALHLDLLQYNPDED